MAISATHLVTANDDVDRSSYTTASISPSANKLILIAVASSGTPSSVTGNGLTWTSVTSKTQSSWTINVYRALSTTTPTPGAVTFGFSGTMNQCAWSINEFSNVDIGGTNGANAVVQSASNSNSGSQTGLTVTLSAFSGASNATYGAIFSVLAGAYTEGSGFSQLGEANTGEISIGTEFKDSNDTSVDWTWGSRSSDNGAIAVEIKHISIANCLYYQQI
jgi:hypothetical protein